MEDIKQENLSFAGLNHRIVSVLPLFYVGWSDSVLSPSEMKLIDKTINEMEFLNDDDKAYLLQWTDPRNPPSAEVFDTWIAALSEGARGLDVEERVSLADFGVQIASSGVGGEDKELMDSPKTKAALERLEVALALTNPTSSRILRSKIYGIEEQEDPADHTSFDTVAMRDFLDGNSHDTNQKMRKLLRDPAFELKYIADKEEYRLRVLHQTKLLAQQGVSAYVFPEEYGGGNSAGKHISVFEMLAYNDLSLTIKFGVQFGLFGGAVFGLGTESHFRKYLTPMHQAELLGCFAMTETGHGSNVKGLETTATYDADTDEIIVHSPSYRAGKEYIGNALHSDMAAVFAQLIVDGQSHGVHAVLVPMRDKDGNLLPGLKVEDCGYKVGLNGVDNGRIWFDEVRVPRVNLLNKYGDITPEGKYESPIVNPSKRFFTMLGALVVGRICVGLASISATKKALTIATSYALKRRQFNAKPGTPETLLMDYPTHMERLIPATAKTYAFHFALRELAEMYDGRSEDDVRKIETLAAGLKSKATWHATQTIQTCREACGGKGYLAENQFANLKADTDIFTTFEGDNTVLMQLVAKGVLTEFKQSLHDDGFKAVISFLLKKVGHSVSENRFVNKRDDSYAHLTSADFYKEAFEYRYEKILIKLSERMRKYLKRKMDPHEAFLKTQIHMVDLANAYIDLVTLRAFYKRMNQCENAHLKGVLEKVYQLYSLTTIWEERGWFLENDYMDGVKTKAIRKVRAKLQQDLSPNMACLVESFGIPDEMVKAPIALQDWS